MNIHEYQAKQVLKGFGAPVANGVAITSLDEAEAAVASLPGPIWVVKSQIHAGGRGKGKFKELPADAKGGVRVIMDDKEVSVALPGRFRLSGEARRSMRQIPGILSVQEL